MRHVTATAVRVCRLQATYGVTGFPDATSTVGDPNDRLTFMAPADGCADTD